MPDRWTVGGVEVSAFLNLCCRPAGDVELYAVVTLVAFLPTCTQNHAELEERR
jgi:hypothetical protein